jgi:hypothetical protein
MQGSLSRRHSGASSSTMAVPVSSAASVRTLQARQFRFPVDTQCLRLVHRVHESMHSLDQPQTRSINRKSAGGRQIPHRPCCGQCGSDRTFALARHCTPELRTRQHVPEAFKSLQDDVMTVPKNNGKSNNQPKCCFFSPFTVLSERWYRPNRP